MRRLKSALDGLQAKMTKDLQIQQIGSCCQRQRERVIAKGGQRPIAVG